jgi:hypothetical protein
MPPKTLTSPKNIPYTLIALIVVVVIAIWGIATKYNPTASPGSTTKDQSVTTPQTAKLQKIISPNAFFYSKIYPKLDATFISIPFSFPSAPQPLWLSLETKPSIPLIGRLIYHPGLATLDWPKVVDNSITLYQKTKRYSSVSEFLNNPPPSGILIDPALSATPAYSKLKADIIPESGELDLESHNYVLTTYTPPRRENNLDFYETTIDAALAQPNDKNELVWLIYAPTASESSPYYLGNIHVDYR